MRDLYSDLLNYNTMPLCTCPVLVIMEYLRERGWSYEFASVTHSRASQTYSALNAHTSREYLQVLVRWEDFPNVESMKSTEPKGYYRCLLQGLIVPGGRRAQYYQNILSGRWSIDHDDPGEEEPVQAIPAVRMAAGHAPIEDADAVQAEDTSHSPSSTDSSSSSGSSSTSQSSSASSSSTAPSDEEVVQDAPAETPWPTVIDGAPCRLECYRHVHHRPHDRLILTCRHHANCRLHRGIGPNQMSTHSDREPVAYLGAWHAWGRNQSREAHRGYRPSPGEIENWLEANP